MCLVSVSGKSALFLGEILGSGALLGEGKLWLGLDVMYESRIKKNQWLGLVRVETV